MAKAKKGEKSTGGKPALPAGTTEGIVRATTKNGKVRYVVVKTVGS